MAQYNDGTSVPNGDSFSSLAGYYDALDIPPSSELVYMASPKDLVYLNMNRKYNLKVPTERPVDYDVLDDFKYVNAYPQQNRMAFPMMTAGKRGKMMQMKKK